MEMFKLSYLKEVAPYRGAEPLQLQLMATGIASRSALGRLLEGLLAAEVGACL